MDAPGAGNGNPDVGRSSRRYWQINPIFALQAQGQRPGIPLQVIRRSLGIPPTKYAQGPAGSVFEPEADDAVYSVIDKDAEVVSAELSPKRTSTAPGSTILFIRVFKIES